MSRNTDKSAVNSIYRKLGASSCSEVVARAGILACLTGKEPGQCPFIPMGRCHRGVGAGIVRRAGTGLE